MENPNQSVAAQERETEHHFDALLPQQRIRDGRRIHPTEQDRTPCRSDPSCKPRTQRNPYALAHLLLDTSRGCRDKFLRCLIEEQHGRRIGTEHFANSCQELGQQIINVEMCQSRIGERLKARQTITVAATHRST